MATKKKKKKTSKYLTEAKKLGTSKYSPVFAQISANRSTNRKLYDTSSAQRVTALDKELGSMEAAHQATQTKLTGLGAETGTLFQQALAKSQSDASNRQTTLNNNNTGLMSSLQAERQARGLEQPSGAEAGLGYQQSKNNELLSAIQSQQEGALTRQGAAAQTTMKGMQGSEMFLDTTHKSSAKGQAQSELTSLYNTYLEKRQELEGQKTVTEKEKGDYVYQTYLTLKEKAAQRAAEKAQAAMQSAIAQGNLDYKNTALQVNTQYKYDSLASKTAQNDIANKLKKAGLTHKKAMDLARLALDNKKFGVSVDRLNLDKYKFDNRTKGSSVEDIMAAINGMS